MPEEAGFGCVVVYPSVTSSNVGVIYGRISGAGHHCAVDSITTSSTCCSMSHSDSTPYDLRN